MTQFKLKNGTCYELFFRRWKWAVDKVKKIYPKSAKAFPMWKEVDYHFCNSCEES